MFQLQIRTGAPRHELVETPSSTSPSTTMFVDGVASFRACSVRTSRFLCRWAIVRPTVKVTLLQSASAPDVLGSPNKARAQYKPWPCRSPDFYKWRRVAATARGSVLLWSASRSSAWMACVGAASGHVRSWRRFKTNTWSRRDRRCGWATTSGGCGAVGRGWRVVGFFVHVGARVGS